MRSELLAYQNAGVIDVEEEFHQRCFHITVYRITVQDRSQAGPEATRRGDNTRIGFSGRQFPGRGHS